MSVRKGVGLVGIALAFVGFVAGGLAHVTMETKLASFLPVDDPVMRDLATVNESFGAEPVVVLIESDRPRQRFERDNLLPLLGLEGELANLSNVATVYGPGTVLNQIAGQTQDLLAELTGRRDGIRTKAINEAKRDGASAAAAERAGERAVRQFDQRYGSLLVQGLPAGLPTLRNGDFVRQVVFDADGKPRPQWRFVVPRPDAIAVHVRPSHGLSEDATSDLVRDVRDTVAEADLDARRVTVSGVPAVSAGLAGTVRNEVPLLGGLAVVAIGGCFLLIPWTRWRYRLLPLASALLAVAATVAVFGWMGRPLSLGVVAFLSVLLGLGSYYPTYLAKRATTRVVVAVVLATAASFATLALSPLPFVRDLGIALAIGVLMAAGIGALLSRRTYRNGSAKLAATPTVASIGASEGTSATGTERPGARAPRPVGRAGAGLAIVLVAASGWLALPSLPLEGSFRQFTAGLPEMADADHVTSVLGSSGEFDIMLKGDDVLSPEAFAWAQQAHTIAVARHGDELRTVMSPSSLLRFLGPDPTADQVAAAVRLLPSYLTSAVFRGDGEVALLSYGVKLDDLETVHALRDDLREALPEPPDGYEMAITGLPTAAVRANELLSANRVLSNVAGIVAAGTVLLIALRRRADAVRAVLAAGIATGAGLGALWLLAIPLSPLTVAFGSLTAAVACEFTVMLSDAARRGSSSLRRSILLATATSAVGYAVLSVSDLAAVREFGLLLAGSVLLSLVSAQGVVWATRARADTPAMAAGPVEAHPTTLEKAGVAP
ncbi:RND transporter [Haloechinothrix salitolerans]|uniref:RND transporter n=1 Tax=Haloechinothrix salitolerans TaxID=926830 RepID=A0ABW2BVD8_9PSEU